MDKISIIGIATVSFPEIILFIVLGILSIGKFSYFETKGNLIRLLISSIVATVAFYFIRPFVSNVLENLLISFFLYALLLIFVMNFKFYESMLASLFILAMVVVIEAVYIAPLLGITGISVEQMYASDLKRFLYSSPERIIQIVLIFLSYKFKVKIVDLESTNEKKREYYVQLFVFLLSASTLIFLVAIITKTLLFDHGDFTNETNVWLLRINIYVTLFVTIILLLAIRSIDEFHKNKQTLNTNEFTQNLEYISDLLEEKKYSAAKESIDSLINHILKH